MAKIIDERMISRFLCCGFNISSKTFHIFKFWHVTSICEKFSDHCGLFLLGHAAFWPE
jgi:hypothetical protein